MGATCWPCYSVLPYLVVFNLFPSQEGGVAPRAFLIAISWSSYTESNCILRITKPGIILKCFRSSNFGPLRIESNVIACAPSLQPGVCPSTLFVGDENWSPWYDSNVRPLSSKPSTLTRLSYTEIKSSQYQLFPMQFTFTGLLCYFTLAA